MHERRMMFYGLGQVGVVVVLEKQVASGLAKLAQRYGWPLIQVPTAGQVARMLGRRRVDIAVVHIAVELQQAVELVRWLRMTRKDALVIAVASTHQPEVERVVRQAGAHCYLPQDDEVSLERAISEILEQEAGSVGSTQTTDTHRPTRYRGSSGGTTSRQGA